MKRLLLLGGLLLAIITPSLAQTKTDTIRIDLKPIIGDSLIGELCFYFPDSIKSGIEIEWIAHTETDSQRLKLDDGYHYNALCIYIHDSGQIRIYYTYNQLKSYGFALSTGSVESGTPNPIISMDFHKGAFRETSLYISNCVALRELYCYDSQLTDLDISGCTALEYLYCAYNQLATLDVSHNTALTSLDCSHNQLTTLDLSHNTALTSLDCSHNQLTTLDLSHNTDLTELLCAGNLLTNLDLSHNTNLEYLQCYNNRLTTLDLSHNTSLEGLYCSNNKLTTIDVNHNTALTGLDCGNNQLTTLDVSHNTALEYLYCSDNKLTTIDVNHNTALTGLDCENNQLTTLDVSHNAALSELYCYNNHIPLYMLYKAYSQQSSWTEIKANPQTDTLVLDIEQTLDLSYEKMIGGSPTSFKISDTSGYEVSSNCYMENNFNFKFPKAGLYKLSLQNSNLQEDEEPIVFTWHISVVEKLPDDVATEPHETNRLRIYAQDRTIYLSENWSTMQVYNVAGQCVYSGSSTAIPMPQTGVYIVKVGVRSHKVLVR